MGLRVLRLDEPPLPSCPSTQDLCRALASQGAPEGTVVRALEQTAGRGRCGRDWHSPAGQGLWMSFILRPKSDPSLWPALTALIALSTGEAIETLAGSRCPWKASIKWPNDVFGLRGKLAGILAESSGGAVVAGLGVNVAQSEEDFSPEIRGRASSLRLEGFAPLPDPGELAHRFNDRLSRAYVRFEAGDRSFLREGLRERFFLRGTRVRIEGFTTPLEGVAVDIGTLGELLLETAEGLRTVSGGEVVRWERI